MGKATVWAIFVILFFLHQDFWWWEDSNLILGFMPIGLAYHAAFSIACACLWFLAIRYAWPHDLEKFADDHD